MLSQLVIKGLMIMYYISLVRTPLLGKFHDLS